MHAESVFRDRGDGLPRGGGDSRAAAEAPARPRSAVAPTCWDSACASRTTRRASAGDDRASRRGHRHARLARARAAASAWPPPRPPRRQALVIVSGVALAAGLARGRALALPALALFGLVHRFRRRLYRPACLVGGPRSSRSTSTSLMLIAVAGAMAIGAVVRGGRRHLPVRARAVARDAQHGTRAPRDPRPDGAGARRGARAPRRRGTPRHGGRASPSATIIVVAARREDPARRRRRRRRERRQPGADHRRVAARRASARATRCSPARSTATGALEVRVTQLRRDTTMARIINLVEVRAGRSVRRRRRFVERFARVYTPAVIALRRRRGGRAAAAGSGSRSTTWFYRALVLLVISCPCALVISTPVSIVSALAARRPQGRADQGRRPPRAHGPRPLRRLRQDRHADARAGRRWSRSSR